MKHFFLMLLMGAVTIQSHAQSSYLYTSGPNPADGKLHTIDTTGSSYTDVGSIDLSSDIGEFEGCFGLTYDSENDIYYILYSSEVDEISTRKLGTIDLETGNVTQIGDLNWFTDILFADGVLYGTTGTEYGSFTFVKIDETDAATSEIFTHISSNPGQSLALDSSNDRILKFDGTTLSEIDLDGITESLFPGAVDFSNPFQAAVLKNDSIAILSSYDEIYEFNLNTLVLEIKETLTFPIHAFVFGPEMEDVCAGVEIDITGVVALEILGSDGAIDITVTGGTTPYTYDWSNDGTGDFDDTEDLVDLTAGSYTVIVKDSLGCMGTDTFIVDVSISGIAQLNASSISVYPNPTADEITMALEGNFNYQLTNISGETIISGNATNSQTVSLNELSKGIYFVTIKNDTISKTIKVIKQ